MELTQLLSAGQAGKASGTAAPAPETPDVVAVASSPNPDAAAIAAIASPLVRGLELCAVVVTRKISRACVETEK